MLASVHTVRLLWSNYGHNLFSQNSFISRQFSNDGTTVVWGTTVTSCQCNPFYVQHNLITIKKAPSSGCCLKPHLRVTVLWDHLNIIIGFLFYIILHLFFFLLMSPPDFSLLWGAVLTRSGVHSYDSVWRTNSGAAAWRNWQRQWTPAPRPFSSSRMASRSPPALTSAKVRILTHISVI